MQGIIDNPSLMEEEVVKEVAEVEEEEEEEVTR